MVRKNFCRMTSIIALLSLVVAYVIISCGGGGDDPAPAQAPATDLTGAWSVTETLGNNDCQDDPVGTQYFWTADIAHTAGSNSFTLTERGTSNSYNGTISGSALSYSGQATDPDCDQGLNLTAVNLTLQGNNSLSGNATWVCNFTGGSCSGTTNVAATR